MLHCGLALFKIARLLLVAMMCAASPLLSPLRVGTNIPLFGRVRARALCPLARAGV